jgi:hypothetical protein
MACHVQGEREADALFIFFFSLMDALSTNFLMLMKGEGKNGSLII